MVLEKIFPTGYFSKMHHQKVVFPTFAFIWILEKNVVFTHPTVSSAMVLGV